MEAESPQDQHEAWIETQPGENSSVPWLLAVPTLIMPLSPGWYCFYNSLQLCSTEKTTMLIFTHTHTHTVRERPMEGNRGGRQWERGEGGRNPVLVFPSPTELFCIQVSWLNRKNADNSLTQGHTLYAIKKANTGMCSPRTNMHIHSDTHTHTSWQVNRIM